MAKRHSFVRGFTSDRYIWPLKDMAVGDYFLYPVNGGGLTKSQRKVSGDCCNFVRRQKALLGMKFSTRQLIHDMIKVERIK